MAIQFQFRRGTTAEHSTFTGAEGEVTVDTTKGVAVVHDGSTAGGYPMARADAENMVDPQFSGTSYMRYPVGSSNPSTTYANLGNVQYNTNKKSFNVSQYNPQEGYNVVSTFGSSMKLLYSRSVTTGGYTAALNESIYNFSWIVFQHSSWSNQRCWHTKVFKNITSSSMLSSYSSNHCYVYTTDGNNIVVGSGDGISVYKIWGVR